MSDDRERHPTDDPDGTPAHAASLREPGTPEGDTPDEAGGPPERAGYDPADVSGDTEAYRPD